MDLADLSGQVFSAVVFVSEGVLGRQGTAGGGGEGGNSRARYLGERAWRARLLRTRYLDLVPVPVPVPGCRLKEGVMEAPGTTLPAGGHTPHHRLCSTATLFPGWSPTNRSYEQH